MSAPEGISDGDWEQARTEAATYPLPDEETQDRLARLFGGAARQAGAA